MMFPQLSLYLSPAAIATFTAPATSNAAPGFPHYALLFVSHYGLWNLSSRGHFRRWPATNTIAIKHLDLIIKPSPTPCIPAEASAILGSPHMPQHLLFYRLVDEAEALAVMPNCEVVDPLPQNRINQLNHPAYRL